MDTLRADHLGCYGFRRDTSPTIDRLAAENIMLEWVFSPASCTLPSHYSMLTSRYPSFHSVGFRNGGCPSSEATGTAGEPTVAEILSKNGFATAAFVGSSVLGKPDAGPAARGFDLYDDELAGQGPGRTNGTRRRARDTNTAAAGWMARHKTDRFFCWVHYADARGPYDAPHPFGDHFAGEVATLPARSLTAVDDGATGGIPHNQLLNVDRDGFGNLLRYESNYHYYAARYDGGIRYVDSCFARLIEDLVHIGIYDNVLLVLTSDHGEALGENDVYFSHGLTVTMDQIRVPLIFRFPGSSGLGGQRIGEQGSPLDIVPTILDFVGARLDGGHGISLLPLFRGDDIHRFGRRVIFSETETQIAAMDSENQVLLGRGLRDNPRYPFHHPDAPHHNGIMSYRGGSGAAPENAFSRLGGVAADYDSRAKEAASRAGKSPALRAEDVPLPLEA
jgi:arylsulfatase A-like enzyme